MEDFYWEAALRELNAPLGIHHWSLGEIQWETGIPIWMTRRSPSWEGEGGNPQDNYFNPLLSLNQMEDGNPEDNLFNPYPCSTWWRCGTSYKHTGHRIVTWYPLYKHFQQQSHTRQDRNVFWTMVPQGTLCKRPLPRVSGQREYYAVTKGGSSGYGQIHGSYCQCSPYPPKIKLFLALWLCLTYLCKISIKSPRAGREGSLLCH